MLTFKQFIEEMNDNPSLDAAAKKAREAIMAVNKKGATPEEIEFYSKKAAALKDVVKALRKK